MNDGQLGNNGDLPYRFRIPIGDVDGGGHGRCAYYTVRSSISVAEARDAYFAALEKYPDLSPEQICYRYDDYTVSETFWTRARAVMPGLPTDLYTCQGHVYINTTAMAEYVVGFIRVGRPDAILALESEDDVPSITWGTGGRVIGSIGYGLFD